MRGHHPESCPHCVLQQGELWVDTSCASGQRVRRVVQGLRAVKMGVAPEFLIYPNVKKGDRIFLKRLLCQLRWLELGSRAPLGVLIDEQRCMARPWQMQAA